MEESDKRKRINLGIERAKESYKCDFHVIIFLESKIQDPTGGAAISDNSSELLSLGPSGMVQYHSYARKDEPQAGILMCVSPLLPPPKDLLGPYLFANPNLYGNTKRFQGRLMIFGFVFEDKVLILAALYGIVQNTVAAGSLITDAFKILEGIQRETAKAVEGRANGDVVTCYCGDFNAFPFMENDFMYKSTSKSKPTSSATKNNARQAITTMFKSAQAKGKDCLRLKHAWEKYRKPGDTYYTNTTKNKGKITCQTGIDHVFFSAQHLWKYLGKFSHRPADVQPCTTGHDIIFFAVANLWKKPLRGNFPKATYKILPSYIFENEKYLEDLLEVLDPMMQEAQRRKDPVYWLKLYDKVMEEVIPQTGYKFHQEYMRSFHTQMLQDKKAYEDLINTGALDPSHGKYLEADVLWRKIHKGHNFLQKEHLQRAKHMADVKEALLEEEDEFCEEDMTAVFSFRENRDNSVKIIPAIDIQDEVLRNITDPDCLTEAAYDHYHKVFKKPDHFRNRHKKAAMSFLRDLPRVSPAQRDALETLISPEELILVLKEYRGSKDTSPGIDGIPAACFLAEELASFFSVLLANVTNAITDTGKVPASITRIAVRLLNKPGKSKTCFDSYRPVSLMAIALRIITKALTNKINPVLDTLINEQQKAYVPGRRMDHGVTLLTQLIQKAVDGADCPIGLLQVDFKGAFDSLYHQYLRMVLEQIGLGPRMICTLLAITISLKSLIIINDKLTKPFPVQRGIPQGCSLSALLFIIALEPLMAHMMKSHPCSDGVDIGFNDVRISIWYLGYADDLQIPFTSFAQLHMWLTMLDKFAFFSGLHCNWKKTIIHLVGSAYWKYNAETAANKAYFDPTPTNLDFIQRTKIGFPKFLSENFYTAGDILFCGVNLSIGGYKSNQVNSTLGVTLTSKSWDDRISLLERSINGLRQNLQNKLHSHKQRIILGMTRCLSRIFFLAFTSLCPPALVSRVQKVVNLLVFNTQRCPSVQAVATAPLSVGGFGHIDVEYRFKALRLTWISQYVNGTLPTALQLTITESLKHYLRQYKYNHVYPSEVPAIVVDAIPHPTALIDAVIQSVGDRDSLRVDSPERAKGLSNSSIQHCLYIPTVITSALQSLAALRPTRAYSPPEEDKMPEEALAEFLREPLYLNSGMCNQRGTQLPSAAIALHTVGLVCIRDLMDRFATKVNVWSNVMTDASVNAPGTNNSYERRKAVKEIRDILDQPVARQCLRLVEMSVHPDGLHLVPEPMTREETNAKWHSYLPPEMTDALFGREGDKRSLPRSNETGWDEAQARFNRYPLQIETPALGGSNDEEEDKQTVTAVGQMTCKTWYKALIAHRYCYTLKVAAKVPTVFQEGAGWHKLLGIVAPIRSPFLEWQKILRLQNRIGSTRAMEAVPYFCSRVFYHSLFCPPAYNETQRHSTTSTYNKCPRCQNVELSPPHAIFGCPGITMFWTDVFRVLHAMIPELLIPAVILPIHVVAAGFNLLPPGNQGEKHASQTMTIFSLAYRTIIETSRHEDFQKTLDTTGLVTNMRTALFKCFVKYFLGMLRIQCQRLRREDGRSRQAQTGVGVHTLVIANLDIKFIKFREDAPRQPDDETQDTRVSLVSTYYPYLDFPPGNDPALSRTLRITAPTDNWPPYTPASQGGPTYTRTLPVECNVDRARGAMATNRGSMTAQAPQRVPPAKPALEPLLLDALPNGNFRIHDIFTDGSTINNGTKQARAGYATVNPLICHLDRSGALPPQFSATNNAAELAAIVTGLKTLYQHEMTAPAGAPANAIIPMVHTDSMYVIQGIMANLATWRNGGLDLPPPNLIANEFLLRQIGVACRNRTVIFRHVKAHTGGKDYESFYNNIVDKRAKEGVRLPAVIQL